VPNKENVMVMAANVATINASHLFDQFTDPKFMDIGCAGILILLIPGQFVGTLVGADRRGW
jgi:hypothetical protein